MRFVKPLDTDLLDSVFRAHRCVLTLEDNSCVGGFGSAVAEYVTAQGSTAVRLTMLGLPDTWVEQGTQQELFESLSLHPAGVAASARAAMAAVHAHNTDIPT
jgi:1-deoxy-D-xylulose-5-phosphate synthase